MNGTSTLTNVPSVDALLADPSKVHELPHAIAQALWANVSHLEKALALHVMAGGHQGGKTPPPDDMLIGVDDVATLIGMSRSWTEKHVGDLPPRYSVEGNPRWRKSEILAWQKTRPVWGQGA